MKTARVHHAARRRGGGVAACGARAAAGDAGDRVSLRGAPDAYTPLSNARSDKDWRETGYVDGQNVVDQIQVGRGSIRPSAGASGRSGSQRRVAVIAVGRWHRSALAAKAANRDNVPVVFLPAPMTRRRFGLVASFNRPGGNATGLNVLVNELIGKADGVAQSWCRGRRDDRDPQTTLRTRVPSRNGETCRRPARALGSKILSMNASTERDVDTAFATSSNSWRCALVATMHFP